MNLKVFIVLLILFNSINLIHAQNVESSQYQYVDKSADYKKIDYSGHGLHTIIITAYEKSDLFENTFELANSKLLNSGGSSHSYYYFVELPITVKSVEQKEEFLLSFFSYISKVDKVSKLQKLKIYIATSDKKDRTIETANETISIDHFNNRKKLLEKFVHSSVEIIRFNPY